MNNNEQQKVVKVSKDALEFEMKMQEFEGEIRKIKTSPNVQLASKVIKSKYTSKN